MIEIYTIYENPSDYPGKFVMRKFIGDKPTNDHIISDTLEQIRKSVPHGLVRFDRHPADDVTVIETWF